MYISYVPPIRYTSMTLDISNVKRNAERPNFRWPTWARPAPELPDGPERCHGVNGWKKMQ